MLNGEADADEQVSDWSADADNTSDWDNEILFCGYRLDGDTGLYHVRNRDYHAPLGRWMQQDPIGYSGGWNLYEYGASGPLAGADPYGLVWDIQRDPEQPRATAIAGKTPAFPPLGRYNTDSMKWLAWLQGLAVDEFNLWGVLPNGSIETVTGTKTLGQLDAGDQICPDEKVSVPNLVYVVHGESGGARIIDMTFKKVVARKVEWYKQDKYKVDWRDYKNFGGDLKPLLGNKDLVSFFYFGHGAGDRSGTLIPLRDNSADIAPSPRTWVHHRLRELVLLACFSAYPDDRQEIFDPRTTGGRDDVSGWETNVSPSGLFTGVLNSPNEIGLPSPHYVYSNGGAVFKWGFDRTSRPTSSPSGGL